MHGGAGEVWNDHATGGGVEFARAGGGAGKWATELDSFQPGTGRTLSGGVCGANGAA